MYEHLSFDERLKGRTILALQKGIVATFTAADWKEVGYKAGCIDYIRGHARLLRSLSWNDEDYGSCVFQAIERVLEENIENLGCFFENQALLAWFQKNESSLLRELGVASTDLAPQFQAPTLSAREVVERALKDADALMASSGAVSAIDRVHTALHGYMHSQCEAAGISVGNNSKITDLYKLLRNEHPSLKDLGPWSEEVDRILRSFASVLDTLNQLRNNASVAHPNELLLMNAEAELVFNASRTVLHYLDMRLR